MEEEPPLEVKIELPVDAHVPHDYAPGERLRLQAYRAIASANSEEDIKAVREELDDRYGKLPEPVENLLLVAGLRMLARACGVGDIALQGTNIRFAPVELRESQELRLKRLLSADGHQAGHPAGAGAAPEDGEDRRQAAGRAGTAGVDGGVPDDDPGVVGAPRGTAEPSGTRSFPALGATRDGPLPDQRHRSPSAPRCGRGSRHPAASAAVSFRT